MNILLLGNGFDLYYNLPTKYHNFLHTVDHLIENYSLNIKSAGDVFSNSNLQKNDEYIAKCYNAHKTLYDNTTLNLSDVDQLINYSKNNIWFKYLLKSFDKDVGWIDFEKEISNVIRAFGVFLENLSVEFGEERFNKSPEIGYIIKNFDFFYHQTHQRENIMGIVAPAQYSIKDDFITEYPLGSKIKIINKDKIINSLSIQLLDLSNALKIYLKLFADNIFDITTAAEYLEKNKAFLHNDFVVTLNYTDTFEKLYLDSEVFHLHGSVKNNIVLGVNADAYDDLKTIDTSFITFKKYYQRVLMETDTKYLRWYDDQLNAAEMNIHLLVMGHSLDITDKDIISDLFNVASQITILYHNESAKASYITNLVKIFGKSGLDGFREQSKLSFLPLEMDFSDFSETQKKNSLSEYQKTIAECL